MKTSITPHTREANRQHGAKIGYKALATSVARYLLNGKMTPEGMKPDEAAEAQTIYRLILDAHPNHLLAQEK